MITDKPLPQFKRRLAQTIAWCTPRASAADPQNSLRSPELTPLPYDRYIDGYWEPLNGQPSQVDSVIDKRAQLLADSDIRREPDGDLAGGRLLIYFPYENLADWTARDETNGYFDIYDTPAWDTWIGFYVDETVFRWPNYSVRYNSFLLCWVPSEMTDLAEAGTRVCMADCIIWADQVDWLPFLDELRAAGIL